MDKAGQGYWDAHWKRQRSRNGAAHARASLAVCALDRAGLSVPVSSLFSPYVVCVAQKTPPGG
jgi:hypothetical protein